MKKINSFTAFRHLMSFVVVVLFVVNFSWAQGNSLQPSSFSEKSPGTAFTLSLVGTLLPVGLTVASSMRGSDSGILPFLWLGSWVLGPAPGYFYGGLPGRGFLGMGIRTVGVGMIGAAVAIAFSNWGNNDDNSGEGLAIGGVGVFIGSMIYDLAKVSDAVRNHNLKLRERELKISPTYIPQAKAFGVNIQVQF